MLLANGITDTSGKLSKEQQAIIKTVETTLSAYTEKLKSVEEIIHDASLESSTVVADATSLTSLPSHSAVIDIEGSLKCTKLIRKQIDEGVDLSANWVIDELTAVHGPIGWISSTTQPPAVVENIEADAPLTTDMEEDTSPVNVPENSKAPMTTTSLTDISISSENEALVLHEEASTTASSKLSFRNINEELSALESEDRKVLMNKCDTLKNFLGTLVLPHLAHGMIRVARETPQDPIMFLSEFLNEKSQEEVNKSKNDARNEFYSKLFAAEGRTQETTN